MRLHLDVLGWLHLLWGAFGVLLGVSLAILAAGTHVGLGEIGATGLSGPAVVWFLLGGAGLVAGSGACMIVVGRALLARRRAGRMAALLLAAPNLVVVPFGTALGIYAYWALLNDDARREFGRPPRAPLPSRSEESA